MGDGTNSSVDTPGPPGRTDDVPRVDEIFSRAVVAQLAEQRAQRETFSELEHRLENMERVVTERFGEIAALLRSGEVEMRLEVLEEELTTRLVGVAEAIGRRDDGRSADDDRLESLRLMVESRLDQVEGAIRSDDVSRRLAALEVSVADRLGHLEESVRDADLGGTEVSPGQVALLESLEESLGARFGHLEESVRAEEMGRRLKSLELAVDERSSRIEEFVRNGDLEGRVSAVGDAVESSLAELSATVDRIEDDARTGEQRTLANLEQMVAAKVEAIVADRFGRLEEALREMQERTAERIGDLMEASNAAEVGILERIIAESQVVGAHFQAVRPVVEAMAQAGPDLETALVELRRMAASTRLGGAGPLADLTDLDIEVPVPESTGDDATNSLFLPPEETPIPERRFGGRPRRER